eukprot:gene6615-biopygen7524
MVNCKGWKALILFVLVDFAKSERAKLFHDSNRTVHLVSPNLSLPFSVNGMDVFQAMSNIVKCMKTPCPLHHYRSGCERIMSSGECMPCPSCPNWQYRSGCVGASVGICLNVTKCGIGEYVIRQPTSTSDRVCAAPFCSVGEYEARPLTSTTSRQCARITQCSVTQFETNAPTATTDRQCTTCSPTTDFILDCRDNTSRTKIITEHICEVAHVENCCCDEFSLLERVNGNVNIYKTETTLFFGRIHEVGGNIIGKETIMIDIPDESIRYHLQDVDFAQVTRVGGNVELEMNQITRVNFGSLACVDGSVQLHFNALTSVDFGVISHIGGVLSVYNNQLTNINLNALMHITSSLWLYNNALTSIDCANLVHIGGSLSLQGNDITHINFGTITRIGGSLSLQQNKLTSLDFGFITEIGWELRVDDNKLSTIDFGILSHIGGRLRVHQNPSLSSIDCHGLASCLCQSHNTEAVNCPVRCSQDEWTSVCF